MLEIYNEYVARGIYYCIILPIVCLYVMLSWPFFLIGYFVSEDEKDIKEL